MIGGRSVSRVIGANSTNLQNVLNRAGTQISRVFQIIFSNHYTASQFIKIYDKASAPVVATDVPIMTLEAPALSTVTGSATFEPIDFGEAGIYLNNGLAIAITGAYADTDTTASAGAGDVIVNFVTN